MTLAYQGPIIDSCVHHDWPTQQQLMDYLPQEWQEYVGRPESLPGGVGMMTVLPRAAYQSPVGDYLIEADPAGEGSPASDYEQVCRRVLRPSHADRAILSFGPGAAVAGHPNQYLGSELVKAANRWTVDTWLDRGNRSLFGLLLIPSPLPDVAATEIRRAGQHKRIVGALMAANNVGKPFGHALYHPIYEAALSMNLPIIIHSDASTADNITQPTGGGQPATYAEYHLLQCQVLMTHAVSLIAQGVFEKYPELTVILSGAGVTWLTTFLWRLDNDYVALRREVPWMTNLPSHYFRKHFRILTHPFDRAPTKEKLTKLLQTFRGVENLLCFSSGYPRWDTDRADDVASWLPANWHRQVFYDNPVEAFRWPTDEVEPEPPKESSAQGATGPPPGDGDR